MMEFLPVQERRRRKGLPPGREARRGLPRIIRPAAALLTASALSACASVSVSPGKAARSSGTPPAQVAVRIHPAEESRILADRTGEEARQFGAQLSTGLAGHIVRSLADLEIPAGHAPSAFRPGSPQPVWLIEGRITRASQGSRALRSLVGFGAGGTKFEAAFQVFDLSDAKPEPFLVFSTTGGSGARPGGVVSVLNPILLVVNAATISTTTGLSADSKRTGRMVAATIARTLAAENHPVSEKAKKARPKLLSTR